MLEVGTLKNFNSTTYKAGVQFAGSLTTYFDDISVARNIPAAAMIAGNYVIVAIPGENPKDACVIATWPQGTTPQPHASSHKWLGSDEVNIKDLIMQFWTYWHKMWADLNGFTSLASGTGVNTTGFRVLTLSTGTTINSTAGAYASFPFWFRYDNPAYQYRVEQSINFQRQPADSEVWFGFLATPSIPTLTQKHVAFRILDGEIYASCGDGATGTQVDTGVAFAYQGQKNLLLKYMGADIKYYIDGVLKATITTNRPVGCNLYFTDHAKNLAAVDQVYYIYPTLILAAGE
jgi:hypothetical protein